jgi:hypothetical protein
MGIAQVCTLRQSQPRRSSAVVLSAAIKCSSSQAIRYAILEWTGTADAPTKDVVLTWTSGTYTAGNFFLASNVTVTAVGSTTPSAATWTTISLTGTLGASCNNLYLFVWTEGTAAQNVTLDVSEVVLIDGTAAPTWQPDDLALQRCQQFFCKTFDTDQVVRANVGINSNGVLKTVASGTALSVTWPYPVEMFVAPAVTTYNPAAAGSGWRNNGNSATLTASVGQTGTRETSIGGTGATDQVGYQIHISADARLGV